MKKISERDIQLFVGGAFALIGFRALVWLPSTLWSSPDAGRIISSVITILALPIGIGILFGRTQALRLAQLYLWLTIIAGCIVIPTFYYFSRSKGGRISRSLVSEMLVSTVLLGLIFWSRSRRIRHEPDA
jgi:hypothetical protein